MTPLGDIPPDTRRQPTTVHDPHEPPQIADDLGFALPEPAKLSAARAIAIGAVGVAILGVAFVVGYLPRRHAKNALAAESTASESAMPRVEVVKPKIGSSDRSIALPGSVQPLEETVVYPLASGYIRKWNFDIGDKVKEGDVLAEIETPELDQQLEQARAQTAQSDAQLLQSKANSDYSKTQLERYVKLAPAGVASQQELDKQQAQAKVDEANVTVAKATVDAMQANVRRLAQQKQFARVVAPFAGTVTSRNIERGTLVTAGNGSPLFKISATDPMRVFVQVPQDIAPSIRADIVAKVSVREYPGRVFDGKVARSAGALDSATRTMNTEVRVPNPKNELLGGMYATVALTLPEPHRVYELPATVIINDASGLHVATVAEDGTIHVVPVTVERDTGPAVEISTGLTGNERVVKLASADLVDGRAVEVMTPKK